MFFTSVSGDLFLEPRNAVRVSQGYDLKVVHVGAEGLDVVLYRIAVSVLTVVEVILDIAALLFQRAAAAEHGGQDYRHDHDDHRHRSLCQQFQF